MLRHLSTLAALACVWGRELQHQKRIVQTDDAKIALEVSHNAAVRTITDAGSEISARVERDAVDRSVSSRKEAWSHVDDATVTSVGTQAFDSFGGKNIIGGCIAGVIIILAVTGVGHEIYRRKSDSDVTDIVSTLSRASTLMDVGGDLAQEATEDRKATEGTVSTVAAIFNLLTVMVGCGVLRFPQLVAQCGWVLGGVTIVASGFCNYLSCMALTRACDHAIQKRPVNQFRDIVDAVFGPVGATVTDVVFMSTLVSICAVYTTLLSDYSYALFGTFVLPPPAGSSAVPSRWTIGTGCMVALIAMLKDISFLSKLAILGVISGFLYVVAIVGGGLTRAMSNDLPGGSDHFYAESFWPRYFPAFPTETEPCASEPWHKTQGVADSAVTTIKAFSVMLFGYCCSDALTSFRLTMRKPEELPAVLKLSHVIAIAVYLAVGYAGFYGFGVETNADILQSLCTDGECVHAPEKRMIYYYILGGSVVLSIAVTLPFSFFVLFKTLSNKIELVRDNAAVNTGARIGVVAAITTVCVLVPSFTKMMDVMCDGFINAVVMIIPASCCVQIRRAAGKGMDLLGATDIFLVILGFVNAGIGLSGSIPKLFETKISANACA